MNSEYTNLLSNTTDPIELPAYGEPLEIVAQPCFTSRLRYRSDYDNNKNRRGVLRSRNNPNYQSPAIHIPQSYLNIEKQFYIRICLVTIENENTKCRYVHPYELEDINNGEYNDAQTKAVWIPIQRDDADGIKCFPNLRIVKKKADDLKTYGDFHVFDSQNPTLTPQLPSVKDTIKEFNLEKSQLAFTIGNKIITDENITYITDPNTTVFSEEMNEIVGKETDSDTAPSESTTLRSQTRKSSICQIYKYAPRNGYTESTDEILIFFTNKLKIKKYGNLEITFEYDTPTIHWQVPVINLEVKDQMVSFRTPRFPFLIDNCTTVNIVLKQRRRVFEPLTFDYIPIVQCPQCQRNAMQSSNIIAQSNPNKRTHSALYTDDDVLDSVTVFNEDQQSNVELTTPLPTFTTMHSVPLSSINGDACQQILDKLAQSITLLFSNQDSLPILRICRPFIRKCPELIHEAIEKNYSNLIPNFISIAGMELLKQKNELGETVLLHATRINRIDIIKAILLRKNSDELLKDFDNKKQNIFHILALHANSNEILDLFIDHLLKNSINIQQTFDHLDEDNYTPLKLAILNNNLSKSMLQTIISSFKKEN